MKDVKGKPQLGLLSYEALSKVAEVREFGNEKYGSTTNYLNVPCHEFLNAALRHVYKHLSGEEFDHESGLLHLAHAGASVLLGLEIWIRHSSGDGKDLPIPNTTPYQEIYRKAYNIVDHGAEPDRYSMKEIIKAWEEDIIFQTKNEKE